MLKEQEVAEKFSVMEVTFKDGKYEVRPISGLTDLSLEKASLEKERLIDEAVNQAGNDALKLGLRPQEFTDYVKKAEYQADQRYRVLK